MNANPFFIFKNPNTIKFLDFLIENENQNFSILEISEKTGFEYHQIQYILKILGNFVEKNYAKISGKRGTIAIPKISEKFKEFYQKIKILTEFYQKMKEDLKFVQ